MQNNFVPQTFNVPDSLETEKYRLEILTPDFAELDYDAVMSSKTRLRSVFAENTEWPKDDMSLADNIKDLQRHEEEFKSRKAFAYTVLAPKRHKCIGCVYIDPCKAVPFDCEVYLWVRDDSVHLENDLYNSIRDWLVECWPFKKIVFPGRDISWQEWKSYM
jgi:hypothetical protein